MFSRTMKNTILPILTLALGLVCQLRADLYDFSFTESAGGPTTATGRIDVVGGFAVSGYLDVTGGLAWDNTTLWPRVG